MFNRSEYVFLYIFMYFPHVFILLKLFWKKSLLCLCESCMIGMRFAFSIETYSLWDPMIAVY